MVALTLKSVIYSVVLSVILGGVPALAAHSSSSCFKCHDKGSFAGRITHAPVAEGDCVACHSPHAAKQVGLLKQPQTTLCLECHEEIAARLEQHDYVHSPLRMGVCTACHDPHVSEKPALLRAELAQACWDCHDRPEPAAYEHQPFAKGQCSACHDPHSSDDFRMLKKSGADLCLGCHTQNQKLVKSHLGRNLKDLDCLACHNPHGSASSALVRNVQHDPFAAKSCYVCHDYTKEGVMMCLQCHADILPTFNKIHTHLRGNGEQNFCVNCHNPHAGDKDGLLPKNQGTVCRGCHEDTFARREASLYKHGNWETCTNCHSLHGSDHLAMLKDQPDKVCAKCHEEHIAFTHPLGDQAADPRTGQGMTCVSCHDPNAGTQFTYFLRGGAEKGLCMNCHKGY